jgi:saccharopine dehydrogenase-like NADP-dependent oxidoreductase
MKVFALGGYGKVGFAAAKLLAQSDLVTEIAIVGRNLELAEKAVTEVGEKAIAVHADGTDEQELTSLLADHDIIMNAATHETVLPAIRTAARTGTHYCDVASFGGFVEQVLHLSSEAEAAGISAIIANGVSPCISNLMGVHVAHQLEKVEQLQLGRADIYDFESGRELTPRQWLKDPKESLATLHDYRPWFAWILHLVQENGIRNVLNYQEEQWVETDPFRSGLEVPLPQGGTITSYPYFSGDPYFGALPRDLSTVPPVEMYFSPLPLQRHDLLREQALRVIRGHVDSDTAVSSFYDSVESDPHRWLTLPDDFVPIPKMWVRAVGHKDGRAARHTCWLTPAMWNVGGYFLTSVALAVAVRKILRGEVQERGVMHAETAFDPQSFFNEVVAVLPDPPPDGRLIDESFEWLE